MAYTAAQLPYFVSGREAVGGAAAASEPASAPTVVVPRAGERFADEDLAARYGVPLRGGIRVSRANKCIVLVHVVRGSTGYTNTDHGASVTYMGQNADREGVQNQQMSGNNLDLCRSKEDAYTVLYFTREEDDLVFNSRIEYASHGYEVGTNCRGQPRVVVKFELRTVAGPADAPAVNKMESLRCPCWPSWRRPSFPRRRSVNTLPGWPTRWSLACARKRISRKWMKNCANLQRASTIHLTACVPSLIPNVRSCPAAARQKKSHQKDGQRYAG